MNTRYAFRKYLLVFLPVIMIYSCKKSDKGFLDKTDVGQMNQNTVFADSLLTFQFLNGVYADLPTTYYMDNGVTGGGLWSYSDASDDSECRWSGTTAQAAPAFNLAQFASLADFSRFKNHWNSAFTNIRRVNVFLGNVDRSPISAGRKQKLKGEARFLRAYYYYHLLRNYSGLPLLGDRLFGLTDDFNLPRSSFAETVSYISAELDACSGILPLNQLPEDYGRPTKGAAMALKSRLLLLAASPLFNGENPATGGEQKKLAGYENFDANRWKLAADAAKAVMDLNLYQLVEDNTTAKGYGFYKTLTDRKNSEQIFQIMMKTGRWYEGYLLPVTRGGQAYSYPTQSLVDAYPMANGKMKDEAGSGYSESDMYKNRDPRFGYTILYNQATWLDKTTNKPTPVNLYFQAAGDGLGTSNSTRTGYLFRKFCNENAGGNYGVTSDIGLVSLRYAEILLNYAEAENEFQGPGAQVYAAVEAIRRRAGLDPYQLPGGLSKEDMRQVIRNERRVEFAFEEAHRFFDVKRWKIAEKVLNGDAIGMRWVKNGNAYTGTRFAFETRVFLSPQMYYFPIPQSEINKSSLLIQNPGW
ncbi:RagB/SusD family nutrient uptake outer membrane protein [Pedobacter nutrimenti]|uniref:RagB/SusD family nutrient uptake outer membrane protein n=1 Tax=Pedobacter nutrimenti TaxID=1241337 RepID=UPI00292F4FF1|nr:RagB/SusD family nutrient uptake outer membrane protein [Pedobacter nutrimenti]